MDALSFSTDRSALEAGFALIGEGIAYLAAGSEMGFGLLADPARWLAELEAPAAVLDAAHAARCGHARGHRRPAARNLS